MATKEQAERSVRELARTLRVEELVFQPEINGIHYYVWHTYFRGRKITFIHYFTKPNGEGDMVCTNWVEGKHLSEADALAEIARGRDN